MKSKNILGLALVLTILAATVDFSPGVIRRALQTAKQQPDFGSIQSPELTQALTDAESFWKYVTAPETKFELRRAAVAQAQGMLPLEYLPKLVDAEAELQKEQELHGWGLADNNYRKNAAWLLDNFARQGLPRERTVLGHAWRVPYKASSYPITWKAKCEAPWPWQVQQALQGYRLPRITKFAHGTTNWAEAILKLPCNTDAEAELFVGLSRELRYMPVYARWRKIAMDPTKPNATRELRNVLYETFLRVNPEPPTICQVILTDVVKTNRNLLGTGQMLLLLPDMRVRCVPEDNYNRVQRPIPATSVLAVSEEALNPANGEEWVRLLCYVTELCWTLDSRKLNPAGHMEGEFITGDDWNQSPLSPFDTRDVRPEQKLRAKELMENFEKWFRKNEVKLREEAAKEASEIERVRNEMIALEP
jgi:hypothetical protein